MTLIHNWGWGFSGGSKSYSARVKSLFGSSLIQYLPMNETAGTVAYDISGQGNNGAYTGATLANAAGPSGIGGMYPRFDGTNDVLNATSAGYISDFVLTAGTFFTCVKIYDSAEWAIGTTKLLVRAYASVGNNIDIQKNTGGGLRFVHAGGGTGVAFNYAISTLNWFMVSVTWTNAGDEFKAFVNGGQVGTTQTGLGTLVGPLNRVTIGAADVVGSNSISGWMCHSGTLNRAATPAEMLLIAQWAGVA